VDGVQADGEGLGESGGLEGHGIRDEDALAGRASKRVENPPCMCGVLDAEPMK
jgi:hypothetical protein